MPVPYYTDKFECAEASKDNLVVHIWDNGNGLRVDTLVSASITCEMRGVHSTVVLAQNDMFKLGALLIEHALQPVPDAKKHIDTVLTQLRLLVM